MLGVKRKMFDISGWLQGEDTERNWGRREAQHCSRSTVILLTTSLTGLVSYT